jgi:SRSO17 transposase
MPRSAPPRRPGPGDQARSPRATPERREVAWVGLGENTAFATKPELAARMVARFLDAGHQAAWVAGDEVYGGNPKLRDALEKRGTGYVLAVACSHEVTTGARKFRADTLAKKVPKRAWQKLSAGAGAKGHRFYDWAVVDLADPRPGSRQLLIRRNRSTGELAYYRCYAPTPVPLTTLVRVAGSRWRVEEYFQAGKGLAGLDEHQVRRYASWSRWVTLAMLAARLPRRRPSRRARPPPRTRHPHTAHLQRNPTPFHRPGRPTHPRRCPPAGLVRLATPSPGPVPGKPLPATSRAGMKITIYGWSQHR